MKRLLALLLLGLGTMGFSSYEITSPITDPSGIIDPAIRADLEAKIRVHHTKTGVQIAVLVIETTEGKPIEDVSLEVAQRWGVERTS